MTAFEFSLPEVPTIHAMPACPSCGADGMWANDGRCRACEPEPQPCPFPVRRYPLLSAEQLAALPPMQWRVKGIFPSRGVGALYGPSGGGKSFLAFHLLAHIAVGADWFSYRTKQARCCYLGLEGEAGLSKRLLAYQSQYGGNAAPFLRFGVAPFHLGETDKLQELATGMLADGLQGGVLCIDTLAVASAGMDENSGQDMSLILQGAAFLAREIGGLVILVHHTGKDTDRGMRGHSSLRGNLDAVLKVEMQGASRCFIVEKSKDGEAGQEHGFDLAIATMGMDDDGDGISSCYVVPCARTKKAPKLTPAQQKAFDALCRMQEPMSPLPAEVTARYGEDCSPIRVATIEAWREAAYLDGIAGPDTTADARAKAFKRACTELEKRDLVKLCGDWAWAHD